MKHFILVEVILNNTSDNNIPNKNHFTEIQLQRFNDLIETILNIYVNNDFDVTANHLSDSKCSYFITNGNIKPVEVIFTLAHTNQQRKGKDNKSIPVIHSIRINHEDVTNGIDVILKTREICNHLNNGDFRSYKELIKL